MVNRHLEPISVSVEPKILLVEIYHMLLTSVLNQYRCETLKSLSIKKGH